MQSYQHVIGLVNFWSNTLHLFTFQTAEKDEFEHQQKELEAVCTPIITKLYQAAGGGAGADAGGMPGGMSGGMPGGMPAGFSGGAPSGGDTGSSGGPTIEEDD